ncbi:MAG: hypothetical protein KC729_07105 [Candidatus Eisenbacteria bacterium]|uniref:Uncharacterized protein n=1 Tax=Eiseniibacteriota bacterium TaxID=2212470 RepID=A0A956LXY1_UNCEI|nr:hypothetical protein [Candidatus Eisenbacteria bacterium]
MNHPRTVQLVGIGMLLFLMGCAGATKQRSGGEAGLLGTWKVDLRPTPDAEPYYQEFIVEQIEDGTFRGSFYHTPVENARLNTDWGEVHFAFTTADNSGAYNTSGVLRDGILHGTTHSLARGFLAVWTAERVALDAP